MGRQMTFERTPAQIKLRKLTVALANKPLNDYEIADILCAGLPTARTYLRILHRKGEIHIKSWERAELDGLKPIARKKWALGPGKDAPKPPRLTSAQNAERFRKRLKKDPERHEERRRADRVRKRLKQFSPRPDIAAAWIPRRAA